jgi:hypothetical protein
MAGVDFCCVWHKRHHAVVGLALWEHSRVRAKGPVGTVFVLEDLFTMDSATNLRLCHTLGLRAAVLVLEHDLAALIAVGMHSVAGACWGVFTCVRHHLTGIHLNPVKSLKAPYPCLLDKFGAPFKPVYNMARIEHNKLVVLGPLLLSLKSQSVIRLAPSRTTPIVLLVGMPLKSISTGPWVVGHLNRTATDPADGGAASTFNDCVVVTNDDPINTQFPSIDLGATPTVAVKEVDQDTGELVPVTNDAPDVAGFHLWFEEGGARVFCWGAAV